MSNAEAARLLAPELEAEGIHEPMERVERVAGLMKGRVDFIKELVPLCRFFFVAPDSYDEKTRLKRWKEYSARQMQELKEVLAGLDDFSMENQEKAVMEWIESKEYKTGDVMNAFRLALVGQGIGPHMFEITDVLGKEETLARLQKAIDTLG